MRSASDFSVFDVLVLSQIPNIGPNRLRSLVSYYGVPSTIFSASAKEIATIDGFSKKLSTEIAEFFRNSKFAEAKKYAEQQLSKLNKFEGRIITFWDSDYPELLKKIYDPPVYLFVYGELLKNDEFAIGIVGTRTPTRYGKTIAEQFSQEIVKLGITLVSGLARGIDTVAHSTALKAGGRTIAVIGSGLDVFYPPENKNLFQRISQNGAILSEYEMGTKPDAGNFPRRNRIISGCSLGTLVIETDVNGGAMITANTALDQNREVFAIPGNINSKQSRGSNELIKKGRAKLVETVDDMLEELVTKLRPLLKGKAVVHEKPIPPMSLFEKAIYDSLSEDPLHIDKIAEAAKISTADALVNLLNMEFNGLVKQLPGKTFIRL